MGYVLHNKHKVLLNVVKTLSKLNKSTKFAIEKNLFLLKKEEHLDMYMKFYNFFPYKYGPFSNISYLDINNLRAKGFLTEDDKHPTLTEAGKKAAIKVNIHIQEKIKKTAERFDTDTQIKDYVYDNYPDYTVKSQTPRKDINNVAPGIYTIGYEGKDIDLFLDILIRNNIHVLVDVRKNPFSMNFSFTKSKLSKYLEKVNIEYLHLPELGIEGEKRKNLSSIEDYKELFKEYNSNLPNKHKQIKEIIDLGKKKRIAMMCFEEDKNMCHRGVISDFLESEKIAVDHL